MTKEELKKRTDLVRLIEESGVVLRKGGGSEWTGKCPLHDDQKASLNVNGAKQLWKCMGCGKSGDCFSWVMQHERTDFKEAHAILQARYGNGSVSSTLPRVIEAPKVTTWSLTDSAGNLIEHVRIDQPDGSKTYKWKRNGLDGLDGLKTADLPLYGMERLSEAAPGEAVTICEGEKCADALNGAGRLALGTVTGANVCPSKEAFIPLIGSERVYLWPDNDAPGYGHMTKVAERLKTLGVEPWLIKWPEAPPKGDAADFIAKGGDLGVLYTNARPWQAGSPTGEIVTSDEAIERKVRLISGNALRLVAENVRRERTGVHARVSILLDDTPLSWDVFNVERSEERGRLAKSAYQRLPEGIDNLIGLEDMKGRLDSFAASLWDTVVSQDTPKLVTPSDTLAPIAFYAEPFVMRGGGTIMFAPPGFGKSFMCLCFAVSIDAGISKLWPVKQARVLFINLERSAESIERRLWAINKALGLPPTRSLMMLNRRGHTLADIADGVKRFVKQHGVDVIFLDSISRTGAGDLIENQTANRTIDLLSALCPTWFALAHSPRADETHVFGSMHFEAGSDVMVRLASEKKGDDLGIGLSITKSNDIPHGEQMSYCLSFQDRQLVSVRAARPYEFGELALARQQSPIQEIVSYLLEKGKATATQIANDLGRNRTNVSKLLNNSEEFVKVNRDGPNQFWGLKDKLL